MTKKNIKLQVAVRQLERLGVDMGTTCATDMLSVVTVSGIVHRQELMRLAAVRVIEFLSLLKWLSLSLCPSLSFSFLL